MDHWTKQLRNRVKSYQEIINLLSHEQCECFLEQLEDFQAKDILLSRMRAIQNRAVVADEFAGKNTDGDDA